MAVVYTNINSGITADKLFKKLYEFNKGKKGQYKYVYMKRLKSGKYQVGLLQKESKSVILRRL